MFVFFNKFWSIFTRIKFLRLSYFIMIIYCILCSVFFIPSIYSSNITLPKMNQTINKIVNARDWSSKTKLSLQSEGGSILSDKSALTSKDNITVNLLNLDEGFGKIKEKPVHARKGVNLLDDTDPKTNITIDLNTLDNGSSPIYDKPEINLKTPANSTVNVLTQQHKNNTVVKHLEKDPEVIKADQAEKSEIPKKPLKTVYETLASLGQGSITAKTSVHTLILDQIPSPKKESSVGKNPGMITPIVITILVVPMFAVLGYMALRRGQEAWKNRHYKRMDFLLDGMYND